MARHWRILHRCLPVAMITTNSFCHAALSYQTSDLQANLIVAGEKKLL
jgi:hypothetical protein